MTIHTAQQENQEPSQVVTQKENSSEVNIRRIARSLEEERGARMKLEQELALMREASKRPSREDDAGEDEPYVDQRRLQKELSKFAENLEKNFERKVEEKAGNLIERERQQNFLKSNPDFNAILNDEAVLQKFVDRFPEMAEPLLEMPDNFARKKLVYQNIKALGLTKPDVAKPSIQEKIDANRRSPYYQPTSGNTPPYAQQGDFSVGGQKNAYSKMQELIKGRRA